MNATRPRPEVIRAFHHQIALEAQNNPPPGYVYCELPNSLTAPPIRVRTGPNGPQVEEYYRERLARVGEDLPFETQEPAGNDDWMLGGIFVLGLAFWGVFFWLF